MTIPAILVNLLLILGGLAGLLAAVAVVRLPDLYTRMHGATKAGTLGVACVAIAVAAHFRSTAVTVEALLVVIFLFVTAPIASHLIARAARGARVPFWEGTRTNPQETGPDEERTPGRLPETRW